MTVGFRTSILPPPDARLCPSLQRWRTGTTKATLIPHYEERHGILDHEFVDAGEGVWHVTGRVVPLVPCESVYIMTLPKPDSMPAEAFEAGMRLMDEELAVLKACIESKLTEFKALEPV